MSHDCRPEDLEYRVNDSGFEPHGERTYCTGYQCRECGARWTEEEADRLAEETQCSE